MKYKNIRSAIHNFGHSFVSDMNYIDADFTLNDLSKIHKKGKDININWLTGDFEPSSMATDRIRKSIEYWTAKLQEQLSHQDVEISKLASLRFCWPAEGEQYMQAIDDRGKEHIININQTR